MGLQMKRSTAVANGSASTTLPTSITITKRSSTLLAPTRSTERAHPFRDLFPPSLFRYRPPPPRYLLRALEFHTPFMSILHLQLMDHRTDFRDSVSSTSSNTCLPCGIGYTGVFLLLFSSVACFGLGPLERQCPQRTTNQHGNHTSRCRNTCSAGTTFRLIVIALIAMGLRQRYDSHLDG
ncbi:hypothetical protein CI238_09425 [Colletotrichum incanum]|uniref:Uncharacterized protein n=1 Tax=Colletotrichum incanum TaxID=1573173 RepID=A0A161XY78_COLIC|nr:hypothetical protein CI238_09425 [Colletotrichum incanum]